MNTLNGFEILITRPQAQAEVWAEQLFAAGAVTRLIPLLQISPLQEESQTRAIKNKILDLDHYQKIIFVSQNAVVHGMQWVDIYWPQLPIKIDYFAVGATTAKLLETYGVKAVNLAQDPTGAMTSEALLESRELQQVFGQKILIVRGVGGRGHMAEVLRERGATVDYCEVYQRSLPNNAAADLHKVFLDDFDTAKRVVTLHSGEALENFVQIIAAWPKSLADSAYNTKLLVPSERIANLARGLKFTQVFVADNATDAAMQAALSRLE